MDEDIRAELDTEVLVPLWPNAGRIMRKGRNSTYRGAQKGDIPTVMIGGARRVPVAWLREICGLPPVPAHKIDMEAKAA